jgi:AraC-like DNA-binding protein
MRTEIGVDYRTAEMGRTTAGTPPPPPASVPTWEELAIKCEYRPCRLAELCGVSLRTLQRHFARHYQVTIADWLKNYRLDQAKIRLDQGEGVKQVAYELGFKQLSHFSRVFKQRYGMPPSLLRQSAVEKLLLEKIEPDPNTKAAA